MKLGRVRHSQWEQTGDEKQTNKVIKDLQGGINLKYYKTKLSDVSSLTKSTRKYKHVATFGLPEGEELSIYESQKLDWNNLDGTALVYFDKKRKQTILYRINDRCLVFIKNKHIVHKEYVPKELTTLSNVQTYIVKNYS